VQGGTGVVCRRAWRGRHVHVHALAVCRLARDGGVESPRARLSRGPPAGRLVPQRREGGGRRPAGHGASLGRISGQGRS
jgi:hypothetical protein